MKQFIILVVILFGCSSGQEVVKKPLSSTCASAVAKSDFKKEEYAGLWIQQGGSIPCENCCTLYLGGNQRHSIAFAYARSQNAGKPDIMEYVAVQKPDNNGTFTVAPDLGSYIVLDTNYNETTVGYTEVGGPSLCLFTRGMELTKSAIEMFQAAADRCNMKLYLYNPAISCKGVSKGKPSKRVNNKRSVIIPK